MSDLSDQPAVRLHGIVKRFGPVTAVDGVDLDIREGEFLTLLGPSGSGKTTVLRMIAGFELPTEGTVELGGVDVTGKPPFDRDVNTVFQDYALFPHLSVAENVGYGLMVRKVPRPERRERVRAALARCGWRRSASAGPSSSPVASASASPWPGPWSTAHGCCCSTSRSAPSTSSSGSRCRSS
jgi:ABC-type Fe3+/spermidine/putrescine transport system ATPase subunit